MYQTVSEDFQQFYLKKGQVEAITLDFICKGKCYSVKYIPSSKNLSAGWKRFVRENSFQKDDMLVFYQVDLTT